jgi:hypothetical protein
MTHRSCSTKQIGLLLQEAALVSPAQIEVALLDQSIYTDLRLGEILALRGWVKQETADFFAECWSAEIDLDQDYPLGYYLKSAALLDEQQVQDILKEQPNLGLRFGAIAVLKGWVRQETLNFFLDHLSPHHKEASAFVDHRRTVPPQRISKISKVTYPSIQSPSHRQADRLPSNKYASASFFSENNLHIGEAQIIVPTDQEINDYLAQEPESNPAQFDWET